MKKIIALVLSLLFGFSVTASANGLLADLQGINNGDINPEELKEKYKGFELHVDDSAHIRYTLGSFSYSLPTYWVSDNFEENIVSTRNHYPTEGKITEEGYLSASFIPLDNTDEIETFSSKDIIQSVAEIRLDDPDIDNVTPYKWSSIDGYEAIYFTFDLHVNESTYTLLAAAITDQTSAFYVEYLNRHLSGLDREHDFLEFLLSINVEPNSTNYDYSNMSLAELAKAKEKINKAMWETDEWQEVTVPAGVYKIGEHIPAGHWTITATNYAIVTWGTALDESKTDMEYSNTYASEFIDIDDDVKSVSWELTDGTYLIVENGNVVFTPFAGISLGFK